LAGDVEAGRNKVRLNRGSVAWIERTTEPDHSNPLPVHADKDARFLIFSSPVIEDRTST